MGVLTVTCADCGAAIPGAARNTKRCKACDRAARNARERDRKARERRGDALVKVCRTCGEVITGRGPMATYCGPCAVDAAYEVQARKRARFAGAGYRSLDTRRAERRERARKPEPAAPAAPAVPLMPPCPPGSYEDTGIEREAEREPRAAPLDVERTIANLMALKGYDRETARSLVDPTPDDLMEWLRGVDL